MNPIHSSHHFMFCFSWKYMPANQILDTCTFDTLTNLNAVEELMIKNKKWTRPKSIAASDYNEFTYFFKHVRKSIYDAGLEDSIVRYYEYALPTENCTYEIAYYHQTAPNSTSKEAYEIKTLSLEITGINMHLFNTGAGIISFDLVNTKYDQQSKEDVLKINEYGRRIYPQFLNFDEQFADRIWNAQRVFLSQSITLFGDEAWKEDFTSFNSLADLSGRRAVLKLPRFINNLFSGIAIRAIIEECSGIDHIIIEPITDDRMFFLSWYGNDEYCTTIGNDYENNDWWYAYVFGDKAPKSIANEAMQKKQMLSHTYQRWSDYGTLFGMSRDSFVCLSNTEATQLMYDIPKLRKHIDTIYYALTILCIAQRISALNFSSEIANLSEIESNSSKLYTQKVKNIYVNYIEFKNKLYFREVTSQIQGIELYHQMQDVLHINDEVAMLENAIADVHNYLSIEEQSKLGTIASWFLPVSLLASILGINSIEKYNSIAFGGKIDWTFTTMMLLTTLCIIWSIVMVLKYYGIGQKLNKYLSKQQ